MSGICQFPSFQSCGWIKGKTIGSGSHGIVSFALNKSSGALFVAKSAHFGVDAQSLEDEADILASLDSPYIVRYLGKEYLEESKGERKLNVFMEYIAGGSLSDMVEKFGGALSEDVISIYARQILYGLKYLREKGIVHCDLKCKNVLLCSSSGNIKLADFGCSKRLKDLKNDGNLQPSIAGTPLWMAPEVLRNEELGFASDIWSLGCTVIEMATGRPPWGNKVSKNPMAAVLKIACSNETPEFPVHFSDDGLDFLANCLERNPRRRWTAEELLEHPFVSGNSQHKGVCSPLSVLDIGIYEAEGCLQRNPFLMSDPSGGDKKMLERQEADNDFELSQTWITVRSG
ncbi:hypothetical protein Tsubulata_042390 [Turnera subulata]|uniref:Protein kinase domain-containing protein n=1 Tax=Turnera subulata TaxID=218843 RepID=A0A9Q0JG17_9ROSI|nr:hypothetical protein Tsubulata_042390 [Turnera subulata]